MKKLAITVALFASSFIAGVHPIETAHARIKNNCVYCRGDGRCARGPSGGTECRAFPFGGGCEDAGTCDVN